ncbi:hypothetical protein A1D31_06800 [Bradyrhizobium liaoningense]|nr:hypothetical protein A1D31_06800 [Bradyrhizobium liaoningense]
MGAGEEMCDDRDRLVCKQLRAIPLHLNVAVRAYWRFELFRSASETINHGPLACSKAITQYP